MLLGGLAVAGASLAAPALARSNYLIPREHLPRLVRLQSNLGPYEIHVAPSSFALYWTLPGGEAIRYRVGIGTTELYEFGVFKCGLKRKWPSWTPTANMIRREPDKYAQFAGGMPGGIENPLGARAIYLYANGRDTLMRIHGTPQPWTITKASSSGCVRMINDHVIDLYPRVKVGTRIELYEKMDPASYNAADPAAVSDANEAYAQPVQVGGF